MSVIVESGQLGDSLCPERPRVFFVENRQDQFQSQYFPD